MNKEQTPDMIQVTSKVDRTMMEMLVFPIIKALYYADGSELHKIVGTGFFIDDNGLFLSARHIFRGRGSVFDLEGAKGFAVYCVHTVNLNRKPVARHIDVESIKTRNDTDIAAGFVEMNQFGRDNPEITSEELKRTAHFNHLTTEQVLIGTKVWTVAYPLASVAIPKKGHVNIHSQSDMFTGVITAHYPERRDWLLHWPCYETDMEIKSGASGGPVCVSGKEGLVFGVNCIGMDDPDPVYHITSLAPLVATKSK